MHFFLNYLIFGNFIIIALSILNLVLSGDADIIFGDKVHLYISEVGKYIVVDVIVILIMVTQIYTLLIVKKIYNIKINLLRNYENSDYTRLNQQSQQIQTGEREALMFNNIQSEFVQ